MIAAQFTRHTIEEIATPKPGFCMVLKDRWWSCDKDGNVFMFKQHYPQCHRQQEIAKRLKTHPDMVDVVFVPWAFIEDDPSRY